MNPATTTQIAWRNIWRNPTRTSLTLLAICLTAGVLVFFISLQFSSYDTSINATVSMFSGHLQVQREGYLDKPEMRKSIPNANELRQKVVQIPGVDHVSLRGFGFALVSSEKRSYGVQVVGVLPSEERKVSTIPGVIRVGEYFSSMDAAEAVLGTSLAKNLKVSFLWA